MTCTLVGLTQFLQDPWFRIQLQDLDLVWVLCLRVQAEPRVASEQRRICSEFWARSQVLIPLIGFVNVETLNPP